MKGRFFYKGKDQEIGIELPERVDYAAEKVKLAEAQRLEAEAAKAKAEARAMRSETYRKNREQDRKDWQRIKDNATTGAQSGSADNDWNHYNP